MPTETLSDNAINGDPKKIGIVYHYFAHYRLPIIRTLASSKQYQYVLISDLEARHPSLKTLGEQEFQQLTDNSQSVITWERVKNFWLGPILWQRGLIGQLLRKDLDGVIFLGDAYFISTWLGAIIARLTGKKIFFWTHGIYGGEPLWKRVFRLTFYRLAKDGLLLYGNHACKLLTKRRFPPERLYNIYNSLNYQEQRKLRDQINPDDVKSVAEKLFPQHAELPITLFVGRLTAEKKLDQLIDAVVQLHRSGVAVNLLLIGGGPLEQSLRDRVPDDLQQHVKFFGPCHDENQLAELIFAATVCVSPGNVGLTAIHALTYGTPVVTHENAEQQMPEFEAIEAGVSGSFFTQNDVQALAAAMRPWLDNDRQQRDRTRANCQQIVDQHYNPTNQMRIIEQALNGADARLVGKSIAQESPS